MIRRQLLAATLCLPGAAHAQTTALVAGNANFSTLQVNGTPGSALPAVGTLSTSGAATIGGALTANAGGSLAGTFTGNKTFSGTTTFTSTAIANQTLSLPTPNSHYTQSVGAMTMVANPTCAGANNIWCLQANPSGSVTGSTNLISYLLQDGVHSTGNSDGISITHNIAPNGTTATGPRVTLDVLQTQVGSNQSGSYTPGGISDAFRATGWMQSNLAGSAANHIGSLTTVNAACTVYPTATFVGGCAVVEFDLGTSGGATSFQRNIHALFVETLNDVAGQLGPPIGVEFAAQGTAAGLWRGIQFGVNSAAPPINPFGGIMSVEPNLNRVAFPSVAAFGIDFSQMTYKAFATRQPFRQSVPIQAKAITGATRLTSDAAAASSFIMDALITAGGTGWTSEPTVTVTGCTGAVLRSDLDAQNALREIGVANPGSACVAEATAALSGGGGSGATVVLTVAGNTLNFSPKSSVNVSCSIVADTFSTGGTDSVGWTISFGATMGATASTTAIIGAPVWVLGPATAGAAAKFSGGLPAAPVADTTLGAINLSITPTTGTWSVGGECSMTKSAQI